MKIVIFMLIIFAGFAWLYINQHDTTKRFEDTVSMFMIFAGAYGLFMSIVERIILLGD